MEKGLKLQIIKQYQKQLTDNFLKNKYRIYKYKKNFFEEQ